ncbi:MAG: hypothetical protein KC439_08090, partial [Yoonia sp.]|nr:hypothetical protein [Yoonia sp.]
WGRVNQLVVAMRTASRRNSSVYLFAILYLLHSKHCSKETGTKPRQDQFSLRMFYCLPQLARSIDRPVIFPNTLHLWTQFGIPLDAIRRFIPIILHGQMRVEC